jgi:hypothetical protein
VSGTLLVADEHMPQARTARKRIVDRQDCSPGHAEAQLDPRVLECSNDNVGA